jgi:hypothetical protein
MGPSITLNRGGKEIEAEKIEAEKGICFWPEMRSSGVTI